MKTTRRCIDLDIWLDIVNKIAKKYNLSLIITPKNDGGVRVEIRF